MSVDWGVERLGEAVASLIKVWFSTLLFEGEISISICVSKLVALESRPHETDAAAESCGSVFILVEDCSASSRFESSLVVIVPPWLSTSAPEEKVGGIDASCCVSFPPPIPLLWP